MDEKIRKVTEAEFLAHVLPEKEQKSAEPAVVLEPDDPWKQQIDSLAPNGEQTVCAVHLANKILEQAMALEPDNTLLKELFNKYETINLVCNQLLRGAPSNHPGYQDFLDAREKIAKLRKELQQYEAKQEEMLEAQKILLSVRDNILAGNTAELKFVPEFCFRMNTRKGDIHYGEIAEWKGKKVRNGSFVTVTLNEEMKFFKLPFALGLKDLDEPLAVCEAHIEELQNIRLLTKTVPHRYKKDWQIIKLNLLYAQTYEDARERLEGLKNWLTEKEKERVRYQYADEHPEIIDLEREAVISETEHTSFAAAFLELEYESLEDLVSQLKQKSPEEIAGLKIILVDNRGDDGEREFLGHRAGKGGKRRGTGLPGGGTEDKTARRYLDSEIDCNRLAPVLAKLAKASKFFEKILSHAFREFINECGHKIRKLHVRFGRVPKGINHVDHFWLASATKELVQGCAESNEIIKTIYPTLQDYYKMALGNKEIMRVYNAKEPYFIHAREFARGLFQRHELPIFEEMNEFLKSAR